MTCKPRHACAVKPELVRSWTLEIDYSRAPCLGADQKTRGLWQRDCYRAGLLKLRYFFLKQFVGLSFEDSRNFSGLKAANINYSIRTYILYPGQTIQGQTLWSHGI